LKTSSGIKLDKLEGIDKSSNSFEIDKILWLKRPIYTSIALNNDLEKLRPKPFTQFLNIKCWKSSTNNKSCFSPNNILHLFNNTKVPF
jgi:hypothetical protein